MTAATATILLPRHTVIKTPGLVNVLVTVAEVGYGQYAATCWHDGHCTNKYVSSNLEAIVDEADDYIALAWARNPRTSTRSETHG